jgi:hypothetical protein
MNEAMQCYVVVVDRIVDESGKVYSNINQSTISLYPTASIKCKTNIVFDLREK